MIMLLKVEELPLPLGTCRYVLHQSINRNDGNLSFYTQPLRTVVPPAARANQGQHQVWVQVDEDEDYFEPEPEETNQEQGISEHDWVEEQFNFEEEEYHDDGTDLPFI